jgi:hypothetical protein
MLTGEQIKQALHAHRVVPLGVANPHGPLGLEQLAEAAARLTMRQPDTPRIERPIALSAETWRKLDELARSAALARPWSVTASTVAAAILEEAVGDK